MVASRKLVEIANLFPVCKFKDKDHLKITKVHTVSYTHLTLPTIA